ncbi:hypothetical protein CLOSTASPAR_05552 [[Clostridium] asparagiforme DSM 15981]|uniref:Uncharacterized protein n=1 Tax=[Clostridium] asparagiforme DSM 15981 TaxID=518636 RepID=C0D8F4_9FIRM|nr:hypothetical protein CLOSTASPAR_05552 [[Clostridium] asparagiforme DSM 15981]
MVTVLSFLIIRCRQPQVDDKGYVSLIIRCRQPQVDDKGYVSLLYVVVNRRLMIRDTFP